LRTFNDLDSLELRQIKTGLANGDLVEVEGNLKPGEQIVTKGSLFIDRAASGTRSDPRPCIETPAPEPTTGSSCRPGTSRSREARSLTPLERH